jgi:CubicO group peptidase (beta-lactamase class C family)
MSHTAPGQGYVFDPNHYDAVAAAIKHCTGKTLRASLTDEILDRFVMTSSVPGHDFATWSPATLAQFPATTVSRYADAMARLAKPYRAVPRGRPAPSTFLPSTGLTGATGLVSSAHDLARFQAALDVGALISPDRLRTAWVAPTMPDGLPGPHALGWFSQVHEGRLVVWQYGVVPDAYSALLMTLPQSGVTLILLANSDALVQPYPLANGDISVSPFARLFLGLF